jgi:hypothetical protein
MICSDDNPSLNIKNERLKTLQAAPSFPLPTTKIKGGEVCCNHLLWNITCKRNWMSTAVAPTPFQDWLKHALTAY